MTPGYPQRRPIRPALPAPAGMAWGKILDRWHDEGRTFHLLRADGSPACGCAYYTTTGAYPESPAYAMNCCGNCNRIAARVRS